MQFPVPQFTDVEDKIIGSLTIIQFGIIFGVGVVVFLFFSVTKSVPVTIIAGILFGIPGLGLAFAPFNGRPIYRSFSYVMRFQNAPKYMVFHRNASAVHMAKKPETEEVKDEAPTLPVETTEQRIKEVQALLQKQRQEETEITTDIMKQK